MLYFSSVSSLSAFFLDMNYVHNVNHMAKGVALVYDMLSELRSIVRIFIVVIVFTTPHAKRSVSLSYILLVAACHKKYIINSFNISVRSQKRTKVKHPTLTI